MQREIVIAGFARTPVGAFGGVLSTVSAPRLGAAAIAAAVARAGIEPGVVEQVIMGNVLGAGQGQAPARQAMIHAGLSAATRALTINKVCGSGMAAIILGAQALLTGESEVVVAGGMESMSQAPYLLPKAREGMRLGHQQAIDSLIHDGLWDPYGDQHMGNCAELCAREYQFSREAQDAYAIESFKRAQAAQQSGAFAAEITPVAVPQRGGTALEVLIDEGPGKANFEKIPQLKPAFEKTGTVTAANASSLNDGAAAVLLMTRERAEALGVKPLASLAGWGFHAQEPQWFTTAPAEAVRNAARHADWRLEDVDLFEVNEAFAVVAMAAQRALEIPGDKLNVLGGAIALGHPIGASGARIVTTLIAALQRHDLRRGVATLCIGGGEGVATCWERI